MDAPLMAKRNKKRTISARLMRNLRACYLRASAEDMREGLTWYARANDAARAMSLKYGIPTESVCGVIAAFSPGRNWELNLVDAEVFLQEWANGARGSKLPRVGSYGQRNLTKASKIASGKLPLDVLGGLKVRAFYGCLANPLEETLVCVDRHAKSAAFGVKLADKKSVVTVAEYPWIAEHYRREALRAGVLPHQYQAVVWVVWRRLRGVLEQNDLPF